jgi:hypothetical protein
VGSEYVLRGQDAIAIEGEEAPMKLVSAGLADHNNLRSAAAEFRRSAVGDDLNSAIDSKEGASGNVANHGPLEAGSCHTHSVNPGFAPEPDRIAAS